MGRCQDARTVRRWMRHRLQLAQARRERVRNGAEENNARPHHSCRLVTDAGVVAAALHVEDSWDASLAPSPVHAYCRGGSKPQGRNIASGEIYRRESREER